jgi:hypothetical protein
MGLGVEDLFSFSPTGWLANLPKVSDPVASKLMMATQAWDSLGDVLEFQISAQGLAGSGCELIAACEHRTGQHHQLTAVLIVKPMLAFA